MSKFKIAGWLMASFVLAGAVSRPSMGADEKPKTSKKPPAKSADKSAGPSKGSLSKLTAVDVGGKAIAICLSGDRAYVATSSGMTILDISKPEAPKKLGSLAGGRTGSEGVATNGKHVFLASDTEGLVVVDVSNDAAPKVVASKKIARCKAVAVKDNAVYVLSLVGKLHVFDISKPASPTEVIAFGLPAWRPADYGHKPASAGEEAGYMAALRNNKGSGRVYKTDVHVTGDMMTAVDWVFGRIYLYDVSTPTKPVFKGTHFAPYLIQARISGDWIYGLGAYNKLSGVYSVKLSNFSPNKPSSYHKCSSCGVLKSDSVDQGGIGVSDSGKHVFWYGGKTGTFQIVDVSNPSQMKEVASDKIMGHGQKLAGILGVTSQGEHIFVCAGAKGLVVYRYPGL